MMTTTPTTALIMMVVTMMIASHHTLLCACRRAHMRLQLDEGHPAFQAIDLDGNGNGNVQIIREGQQKIRYGSNFPSHVQDVDVKGFRDQDFYKSCLLWREGNATAGAGRSAGGGGG